MLIKHKINLELSQEIQDVLYVEANNSYSYVVKGVVAQLKAGCYV